MDLWFADFVKNRDIDGLLKRKITAENAAKFFFVAMIALQIISALVELVAAAIGSSVYAVAFDAMNVITAGLDFGLFIIMVPLVLAIIFALMVMYTGLQYLASSLLGGKMDFRELFANMLYIFTSVNVVFWALMLPFTFVAQIIQEGHLEEIASAAMDGRAIDYFASADLTALFALSLVIFVLALMQLGLLVFLQAKAISKMAKLSFARAIVAVIAPAMVLALGLVLIILILGLAVGA
ncbi:MAG: hypothetical protein NUV67_04615 [archaeon]|nr:hypothetical protein [archaeon]